MPGAFGGLNMMGNALRSFQRAIDVTGHNISNVNTAGYSRQRIQFGTNTPENAYGILPYQLGAGVSVQTVSRVRNLMLDTRMSQAGADLGAYEQLATTLRQIETIFPEPSTNGIGDALGKFFDGWSALASNPNDQALKMQVRAAGQTLAQRVRTAFGDLQTQEIGINAQITNTFDQVDALTSRIAELNGQISARMAGGGSPNDLLDARDQAIEELSSLIGVQTHVGENGVMTVYSGSMLLVPGLTNKAIPRTFDASTQSITEGSTTHRVQTGQLAGLMQGLNKVSEYKGKLDLFANSLRTEVNGLHETGMTVGGATGISFFNDANPQTGAVDFGLSAAVEASTDNVVSGASGAAGDGGIALAMSRLRDQGIGTLGTKTFQAFYSGFVGGIGRDIVVASDSEDTQKLIIQQVESQRQSEMGVNLDDEMANLLQFQRSYQAAAKALSVLDQVTEDLVNLIR